MCQLATAILNNYIFQARSTIKALMEVADAIKLIRSPTGSQNAPGRTCLDIAMADDTARNGNVTTSPQCLHSI